MKLHFVRNGPSAMPELAAYAAYVAQLGWSSQIHANGASVPDDAQVVWWFCGRVPAREAQRLARSFQIHEYASASVPPLAWLKDRLKRHIQPLPQYRVFQNTWVEQRLGFRDRTPYALRDMGVPEDFLAARDQDWPEPTFDFVYLGEMSRLLGLLPFLNTLAQHQRRLLLVGEVPERLRRALPPETGYSGRVPQSEVPAQLRRARWGLNLLPDAEPYRHQTPTKVLEYCAVGLPVVSTDTPWMQRFNARSDGRCYLIPPRVSDWAQGLGEALLAYPFVVPGMQDWTWTRRLDSLPLWTVLARLRQDAQGCWREAA